MIIERSYYLLIAYETIHNYNRIYEHTFESPEERQEYIDRTMLWVEQGKLKRVSHIQKIDTEEMWEEQ